MDMKEGKYYICHLLHLLFIFTRSQDSTIGIATGYGLDDGSEFEFWKGQEIFLQCIN
jgi:hypothetical protein